MKKGLIISVIGVFFIVVVAMVFTAEAVEVNLYLDTAPNAYGSPDWPSYLEETYANIFDGTFVNQTHSNNPANVGTLNYDTLDYMVYSFGDLGNRLHSFYFIKDETVESLDGRFQVSIEYEYDGIWSNPYEEYGWGEWLQPSSWINYDGDNDGITDGVIGSMGNALWGAYGYNTDTPEAWEALAADIVDAEMYLGDTRFFARLDGVEYELRAEHAPVPEPATILLLGIGFGFAGVFKKRFLKK